MDVARTSFDRKRGWAPELPDGLDSEQTLVVAFGASDYLDDPRPFDDLRAAFPRSRIIGCSSAGEIAGNRVQDGTVVVAVARFDHTRLTIAEAPAAAGESFAAGRALARQLAGPDLRGVLVLADGLGVNGSELVRGINAELPAAVVVTGGLAGDGDRFQRTWVVAGGRAATGVITATGLYGDRVLVGHGSRGGWDSFGPERRITGAQGNVLRTLDDRPALALYKEYLGEHAAGLPATGLLFPLAIRKDHDDPEVLVRTILAVDDAAQTLTFAGDVPEGHLAQLMRANFDRLINGAADAALMTRRDQQGPTLALAISCVGRRLVLGERVEEELEAALEGFPDGTTQVGFYSYGELSPTTSGRCDLHNQTMTLTTLGESRSA